MILSAFFIFLLNFHSLIEAFYGTNRNHGNNRNYGNHRNNVNMRHSRNQDRIIGGAEVEDNKHPYFVQIISKYYTNFVCGATIISQNGVVTAARCADAPAKYLSLKVGSHFQNDGKSYLVADVVTYAYREYFKIALLLTYHNFEFSESIKSIKLIEEDFDYYRGPIVGTICGFGASEYDKKASKRLLESQVKIINYDHCRKMYDDNNVGPKSFCATPEKGAQDACIGDLGGPMVYQGKLIGVIQYDRGCGQTGKATVYTKIGKYVRWIKERTYIGNGDARSPIEIPDVCNEIVCQNFSTSALNNRHNMAFCLDDCDNMERAIVTEDPNKLPCAPTRISDSEFITSARCNHIGDDSTRSVHSGMANLKVKINNETCDVLKLKTGHQLLPNITSLDNDVVIVSVVCDPHRFTHTDFLPYTILPPSTVRQPEKYGFIIKQVIKSNPNISYNTYPIHVINAQKCTQFYGESLEFKLTPDMFCITPHKMIRHFNVDVCSEKEGAPILDVRGNLIGIVIWQGMCEGSRFSVALRISKLVQAYYIEEEKIEQEKEEELAKFKDNQTQLVHQVIKDENEDAKSLSKLGTTEVPTTVLSLNPDDDNGDSIMDFDLPTIVVD